MAREALAQMLHVKPDTFDVEVAVDT